MTRSANCAVMSWIVRAAMLLFALVGATALADTMASETVSVPLRAPAGSDLKKISLVSYSRPLTNPTLLVAALLMCFCLPGIAALAQLWT